MSNEIITDIEQEITRLRVQLNELQDCAFNHFKLFTDHLTDQDCEIGDLYTYLIPLLDRTYPGYAPTKKQIEAVLKRATSRRRDDPGKKNS